MESFEECWVVFIWPGQREPCREIRDTQPQQFLSSRSSALTPLWLRCIGTFFSSMKLEWIIFKPVLESEAQLLGSVICFRPVARRQVFSSNHKRSYYDVADQRCVLTAACIEAWWGPAEVILLFFIILLLKRNVMSRWCPIWYWPAGALFSEKASLSGRLFWGTSLDKASSLFSSLG